MFNQFKPAKTPVGHWHSGLVLLFITFILFVAMTLIASNKYEFMQRASRAQGVVIRQNAGKHHVEIKFTTASGEAVQYSQNGDISYEAGEQVTVLYDPKEPMLTASTDATGALWGNIFDLFFCASLTFAFAMLAIFFPTYIYIRGPGIKIDTEE
jgi:hypothetical protein